MLEVSLNQNLAQQEVAVEDIKDFSNLTGFFALLIKIDERNKNKNITEGVRINDRHGNTNNTKIQSKE